MDIGNTPINIYLDLSKAFDSLNYKILLSKLKHYGVLGLAFYLLENYLTNRFQYVQFESINCKLLPVSTGAPQGSISWPFLFGVYINDVHTVSNIFQTP